MKSKFLKQPNKSAMYIAIYHRSHCIQASITCIVLVIKKMTIRLYFWGFPLELNAFWNEARGSSIMSSTSLELINMELDKQINDTFALFGPYSKTFGSPGLRHV